jgi:thioredoxin-like negative regulator of GroEL
MTSKLFSANSGVTELTDRDFVRGIPKMASSGRILAMFYAPWCPYCTKTVAAMTEAASVLGTDGIRVVALNADLYDTIAQDSKIQGFPTIRLYESGKMIREYRSGDRTAQALVSFATKDVVQEAFTGDTIERVIDRPTLVLYYVPWCPHCKGIRNTWPKISSVLGSMVQTGTFDCEAHKDVAKELNVQRYPTIALYHDGRVDVYEGDRSEASILRFVSGVLSKRSV